MKCSNFSKNFFLIFIFFTFVFSTQVIDKENLLDSTFVWYWDSTLSIVEKECSVKVTVSILSLWKLDDDEGYKIPKIAVIYDDTASGFEIYQSNFGYESNFIIPSSLFSEIIPEANTMFANGKAGEAVEYILMNVIDMLYYQNQGFLNDEMPADSEKHLFFDKNMILVGLSLFFIVFLLVMIVRKKKLFDINYSYLFKGMSRSGFFGGDFDNMKWFYGRKKK